MKEMESGKESESVSPRALAQKSRGYVQWSPGGEEDLVVVLFHEWRNKYGNEGVLVLLLLLSLSCCFSFIFCEEERMNSEHVVTLYLYVFLRNTSR